VYVILVVIPYDLIIVRILANVMELKRLLYGLNKVGRIKFPIMK
jgi:hypothetical protein